MRSNISEFSYGYALTEHLIRWRGTQLTGAPIFPNLSQEGQPGWGYDVRFDRPGIPLFLQFKVSECMKYRSAGELQGNPARVPFGVPFYRMGLRPSRYSSQHSSLLELESDGNEVYYAAPAFHEPWELNGAYMTPGEVIARSVFFSPSEIGPLPDDWYHHIAFDPRQNRDYGYLFSTPKLVRILSPFTFAEKVSHKLHEVGERALLQASLVRLKERFVDLGGEAAIHALEMLDEIPRFVSAPRPSERDDEIKDLRAIAYLARTFLECQLVVVQSK